MDLVSIVIPSYNSASFISATLESVFHQDYENFEIIIVDDGSSDQSASIIRQYDDSRLTYVYQPNSGVSVARNKGFSLAKGTYTVFFDADDIMEADFLQSRVAFLQANPDYDYCSGPIQTFPVKTTLAGVSEDIPRQLLGYEPGISSCPSNYMFRTHLLQLHAIRFMEELSSTADRYFLLQVDQVARGARVDTGMLYYRVTENSMSNKLSIKLVRDNETFFNLLKAHKLVPDHLASLFFYRIQYILGLSFIKTGKRKLGIQYLGQAAAIRPISFFKDTLKTLRNLVASNYSNSNV